MPNLGLGPYPIDATVAMHWSRKALIAARQAQGGTTPSIQQLKNQLVWRPNAPPGTLPINVFRTFPLAAQAASQVQGQTSIEVDPSLGPAVIPAQAYAMRAVSDVTLCSSQSPLGVGGALPLVTIADGASFPNVAGNGTCLAGLQNLQVVYSGVGAVPIPLASGVTASILELKNCFINCAGTTTPLIQVRQAGGLGFVMMHDGTVFAAGTCLNAADTAIVGLLVSTRSQIGDNVLTKAAGAFIICDFDASAWTISRTQPGAAGMSFVCLSQAAYGASNRQEAPQQAIAGAAPGATHLIPANIAMTKKVNGYWRVWWQFEVSNAAAGDMTLDIQAAAFGGVLAAVYQQTITVPNNTNKVNYAGQVVFDGVTYALLAADASGRTIVNAIISAGAGNYSAVVNHGTLGIEEVG